MPSRAYLLSLPERVIRSALGLREVGYVVYARRQLSPYLRACMDQFSRHQRSMAERIFERIWKD